MIRYITSIYILLLLIIGCTPKENKSKDTLTIAVRGGPISLNPYGSNDVDSGAVRANIFDSLLERNQEGDIIPALATKWEQLSPTEIQFTLRSNVTFHNGASLTSEDILYSFNLALVSPEMEPVVKNIKEVEIINTSTVKIILKAPCAPFMSVLPDIEIISKKAIEIDKRDIDQDPIGTGPYQLLEWNRGQNVVLERNTNYWREPAHIAKINMIVVPEGSARAIALETGEVDIAYDIEPVDRERIEDNQNLVFIGKSTPAIEYLGINMSGSKANPIWKDIRVREALSLAIDRQGIIDSVYFGMGLLPTSFVHPNLWGYYDEGKTYSQNKERAKELLQEAGITEDNQITLYGAEGLRPKTLEIIQANLHEIGLNANIQILEWGTFLDLTAKGLTDVFIMGWVTTTGDADASLYPLLHSQAIGGGNRTFYNNPILDQKLDAARIELDSTKRKELYKEIQNIIAKELPVIPIFYYVDSVATTKYVKDFIFDLGVQHRLKTVRFE